jgi:peroxiredoxin
VDDNRRLVEGLGLGFPVLSDSSRATIAAYGLVHRGAGPGGADIARPATLLVGRDGTVRWRHLTENWRVRISPDAVLDAISEAAHEPQPGPGVTPDQD